MKSAALSSSISTIVRPSSALLALTRAYFGVTSRVLPGVARRHAERVFTRPPRYAGRAEVATPSRRETVVMGRHRLAVWQAGSPGAPAVLLAHGWGGRGVQMRHFIAPLLAHGFRVVWFDQPGHGESGRGFVGLPDLRDALHAIATTHGPFAAIVGHSLGAAATALALRSGLAAQRVVLIAPPSSMREHTRHFARLLGLTPRIREAMRTRLEKRYQVSFDELDRIEDLARINTPMLFIHDQDDPMVPITHSLRLSAGLPEAHLIRTHGLGHHRILRNEAVVAAAVRFIGGDASALPDTLPALPTPAPLY